MVKMIEQKSEKTKLLFAERSVYGKILIYVADEKAERSISVLTGKKTVTREQITALRELGFDCEIKKAF